MSSWYQTEANPVPADWRGNNQLRMDKDKSDYYPRTKSRMVDIDRQNEIKEEQRQLQRLYGWDE